MFIFYLLIDVLSWIALWISWDCCESMMVEACWNWFVISYGFDCHLSPVYGLSWTLGLIYFVTPWWWLFVHCRRSHSYVWEKHFMICISYYYYYYYYMFNFSWFIMVIASPLDQSWYHFEVLLIFLVCNNFVTSFFEFLRLCGICATICVICATICVICAIVSVICTTRFVKCAILSHFHICYCFIFLSQIIWILSLYQKHLLVLLCVLEMSIV